MSMFYSEKKFLTAVWRNDVKKVKSYLAHKDKARWLAARNDAGNTPLHYAAIRQNENMMKILIEAGAELDAKNDDGQTPLSEGLERASYAHQRLPLARTLLEAGANPGLPQEGLYNPLHFSIVYSEPEITEELLKAKANPNARDYLASALQSSGTQDIALKLLKAGARLDTAGSFPGHKAAKYGSDDVLRLLKERGLDLKETNDTGSSLLHIAAENGKLKTVELLLQEGIDINLRDGGGATALHRAAQNGHASVVGKLLEAGARPDIEDNQKMTALVWARQQNSSAPTIRLLEEAEKDTRSKEATALTATVNVMPASEAETWVLMGDHQVARVGVYPALGRKLTEVFNFESRERLVISENLKTGAENLTPFTPFDAMSDSLVEKALQAFRRLGGKTDEEAVTSPKLSKKQIPGPAGAA